MTKTPILSMVKMPKRKDTTDAAIDIFRAPTTGFNQCIDEIESLNSTRVIDEEELARKLYMASYYSYAPSQQEDMNGIWAKADKTTKRRYARMTRACIEYLKGL